MPHVGYVTLCVILVAGLASVADCLQTNVEIKEAELATVGVTAGGKHWYPEQGPKFAHNWTNRLLLWPAQKFAFCFIEKVGCTQFNRLMNHANGRPGRSDGEPWDTSTVEQFSDIDPSTVTRGNGWRMGIFARDPAERLLSAWSSKCIEWEDHGINCLGRRRMTHWKKINQELAFDDMVLNMLPEYLAKSRGDAGFNAHYDPQVSFCGAKSLADYDFVGRLSHNVTETHEQVVRMFRDVAQVPSSNSSFWSFLTSTFPLDHVAGHSSDATDSMAEFYSDPEVFNTTLQLYAADYEAFGLVPGPYGQGGPHRGGANRGGGVVLSVLTALVGFASSL
mmetsp:Transcript_135991/g.290693  ORF Transcript_135991/g.290693 Transcript_135991/m.290693 type:complete len:335 (+) Transcript_135991:82-1086(+)